ncbi:hypothetical protein WDU94_013667 [Cyamophila willieti]
MEAFLRTGKLGKEAPSSSKPIASTSGKTRTKPVPWVEKYRPKTIDDVIEQQEVVSVLKKCLSGADLPHFLFYGPPGTGKTSTMIAAAHQLFGDMYKDRILELNASDDRGIQVIRDKTASGFNTEGKPCPPFKIVILDEADSMTHAAQAALRRTMEKETKSTRFCLICNYVSCIIQPLTSRCSKFRFKPLAESTMMTRLQYICQEESVKCDFKALETLVETSGGDMRRAITCLQSCARLKGGDGIVNDDVLEVTGVIPNIWIEKLLHVDSFQVLEKYIEDLILEAYSATQLFDQFHDIVMTSSLNDPQKAIVLEKLAECNARLQDGASEYIQVLDLGTSVIKANKTVV